MKKICATLFSVLLVAGCVSTPPRGGDASSFAADPDVVEQVGSNLQQELGSEWQIRISTNRIEIQSTLRVNLMGRVNPPVFSDQGEFEKWKTDHAEPYRFTVRFAPHMAYAEYLELRTRKQAYVDVLNQGARTMQAFGDAWTGYLQTQVPIFWDSHSAIFVEESGNPMAYVLPSEAALKCRVALATIRLVLEKNGFHEYIQ
jgi:hypothetical protein